ncbi:hypothetical protein [Cernens ardua]|uniref:hypothetical protein n=1 Tax=Cernens ardua TaxID=3402176 RepID=UPI003F95D602
MKNEFSTAKNSVQVPQLNSREVLATLVRILLYVALFAGYCRGILWDAARLVPDNLKFSERSFTEVGQSLLLCLAIVLLLFARKRYRVFSVGMMGLAMFLLVSLVRENDYWLDAIAHGFWAYPAIVIIALTARYLWIMRKRFIDELCLFMSTRSFGLFIGGFLTVYVYSRLIGRQVVWETALSDHYVRIAKNMGEEGTESLGYLLIICAVIELVVLARALSRRISSQPGMKPLSSVI